MIADDVFATVPVLTGPRVRLEPLGPAVLEPYWGMLQEPEGLRLTGSHASFSRDRVAEWLAGRADHADRADWAAMRIEDGAFLGEAVVFLLDPANESASFRIGLAGPHVYGQGYGTEITRLVVDHALGVVGLHRLELEVYDHNPRAQRVYEKCGFRVEGRRREALRWDGLRHDAIVMSVLRTDRADMATDGGPGAAPRTQLFLPDGTSMALRRATVDDVPALATLMSDDAISAGRETDDLEPYLAAFRSIDDSLAHLLAVVVDGADVVGTFQLTVLPGLARRGASRAQIEAVRVRSSHRNRGLGGAMIRWAVDEARARGCSVVQLTTDKRRTDAHRFYARLGFVASHEGFKLQLAP